jgi:hypothetical protein
LLSRPKAGVPAGARGRLGGFLSRRTRTLPVRVAADRLEGPPERAKTLRKKGTVRLSGLAGQNADRPELRTHGLALPENDAFPAVVCRDGERSRWTFGATNLARIWTTPRCDTTGRDDLSHRAGRSARSSWLAEGKAAAETHSPRGRPGNPAALCPPSARCFCRGSWLQL